MALEDQAAVRFVVPKLRRRLHAGFLLDSVPPTWDSILLFDQGLGVKIGAAAIPTDKVRDALRDHVPTVLADIIIEFCRRVDFRTILDLSHPSNKDVRDLLLAYGCIVREHQVEHE